MAAEEKHDGSKKKIVYYDNECPMCTAVEKNVTASPFGDKFDFRGISNGPLPETISRAAAEKEIHVVDADGKIYAGSEAMVRIWGEGKSPVWTTIAGLPVIKQLIAAGYALIAANRHFIFGPRRKIFWLKIVTALALLAGFLFSVKLWVSTRFYPLTPVIKGLPAIPYPADYIYFFALIALLLLIIVLPRPRVAIIVFASLLFISMLFDQSRWQPWAYQYLFMLIGIGFFSWKTNDAQWETYSLNICRIIVAGTYFWSGIQKVNVAFISGVFPWLLGPLDKWFPVLALLGIIAPFIEIGIGIGLLTKKFRNIAVWLAVIMHATILIAIGPLGRNWNSVIWPWQIAMVFFVVVLFYRADFTFGSLFSRRNFVFSQVVIALFLIAPLFNFFGVWDAYLSASLYSGDVTQGVVSFDGALEARLPAAVSQYATSTAAGMYQLTISDWSTGEMNVPSYPEARIYRNVAQFFCNYADDPAEMNLEVASKPTFYNVHGEVREYDCSDL